MRLALSLAAICTATPALAYECEALSDLVEAASAYHQGVLALALEQGVTAILWEENNAANTLSEDAIDKSRALMNLSGFFNNELERIIDGSGCEIELAP